MDKLPVRHDGGPARRALDVDGPTHRSFARLESNGRPCHMVEIRVAIVATGSQSARGKRWRSGRHEVWWCAVAHPVAPPAEPAQQKPTPHPSDRCRRIECSSYGPFDADQRSFKTDVNFSNTLIELTVLQPQSEPKATNLRI